MGKLKESIIVADEHNDFAVNESFDYQRIIVFLIKVASDFNMLYNHFQSDQKHYFLDKRDQLTNSAAILTSLI